MNTLFCDDERSTRDRVLGRASVTAGATLAILLAGYSNDAPAVSWSALTISDGSGQKACNTAAAVEQVEQDVEFKIAIQPPKLGPNGPIKFKVRTIDGNPPDGAKAGEDYEPIEGEEFYFPATSSVGPTVYPLSLVIPFTVDVISGQGEPQLSERFTVEIVDLELPFDPIILDTVAEGTIVDPNADIIGDLELCEPHPEPPIVEEPSLR